MIVHASTTRLWFVFALCVHDLHASEMLLNNALKVIVKNDAILVDDLVFVCVLINNTTRHSFAFRRKFIL